MAFTTNATLTVTPAADFVQPSADQDPLHTALLNLNHLYAYHRPPLHNIVYTTNAGLTRSSTFQWPTSPSADGLRYTFRTWIRTGTGTGTLTVLIEENDGGWSTIDNTTGIVAAANSVIDHQVAGAISASATELRVTYTRASSDPYYAESIIVYPTPSTPVTAGETAAGFIPYDTTLLATSGAPLTVEHVNRCKASALAVLTDRLQQCLSFVQENATGNVRHDLASGANPEGDWQLIGTAVASFPGQKDPTITLAAWAAVDAGSTADLIKISQQHLLGKSVTLDASGSVETATLQLTTDGGADSHAILEIWGKVTAGNSTFLHAVQGWWAPGD